MGKESYQFYQGFRHLSIPNPETRQLDGHRVHRWMTVEELAKKYTVPVADVFKALNIQPSPGDEKLTLKVLADKYKKSDTEVKDGLNILNKAYPSNGENNHG